MRVEKLMSSHDEEQNTLIFDGVYRLYTVHGIK